MFTVHECQKCDVTNKILQQYEGSTNSVFASGLGTYTFRQPLQTPILVPSTFSDGIWDFGLKL